MKKKHSKALLISAILGTIYSIYIIMYFTGAVGGSEGTEQVGAALATAMVMPHLILVVLATIFNWVAYFTNKRGFALTAGILFSVGAVLFIIYALFVVPSLVLCFVGFSNLKKINAPNTENISA